MILFRANRTLGNQRGILTVEFIFGIFITIGLLSLLLRLTYTFAVVEVTQYIIYSTSRTYAAAHTSEQAQRELATAKYTSLTQTHEQLASIYRNGWYTVPADPVIGHFSRNAGANSVGPDYFEEPRQGGTNPFIGARIDFQAPVLSFNVPFLGETSNDDQAFSAGIASFLIREPSQEECNEYMARRIAGLRDLGGGRFNGLAIDESKYVALEDNGC